MSINIRPVGCFVRVLDAIMVPVMYLISGTFREKPNRTFGWNIAKFELAVARTLDASKMVCYRPVTGVPRRRWWSMRFNMPIFGGWRKYVVLAPERYRGKWHIGWSVEPSADDPAKVEASRLMMEGPIRMLLGPSFVSFFAINDEGEQIALNRIGEGCIGDGKAYGKIPLL